MRICRLKKMVVIDSIPPPFLWRHNGLSEENNRTRYYRKLRFYPNTRQKMRFLIIALTLIKQ